jgi:maltose-binding protein MalE
LEVEALQAIIDSFKRLYPDVTFSLQYFPEDELYKRYHDAAYLNGGPSLLLGPSAWGPPLAKETLIKDIKPFAPQKYLANINKAALSSGQVQNTLISLPLSLNGLVMFRNISIIPTFASSFDALEANSHDVTHGGIVGSYLERGAYFSSSDILGLGGQLMDEDGYPAFNDSYGLEWLDLLATYDDAGAVTFNTNRDLDMFKKGQVGIIVDGTWNIESIAAAITPEKLAIDSWPSYGTGHLSGWVVADSVYVNSDINNNDFYAALTFIGYLLDPGVQMRLAEVGHIPSVETTQPRNPLIKQAIIGLSKGVPYPNHVDEAVLSLYWDALDRAIVEVFQNGVNPLTALQEASDQITHDINTMQSTP